MRSTAVSGLIGIYANGSDCAMQFGESLCGSGVKALPPGTSFSVSPRSCAAAFCMTASGSLI
jgi:hypothetical protein